MQHHGGNDQARDQRDTTVPGDHRSRWKDSTTQRRQRADGENLALMKAMGSRRGYAPIPPDQVEWQSAATEPPLYRLWSWMCSHTIEAGKKSAFAVLDDCRPATLKHAASDLALDLGFVSNLWKQGCRCGLWERRGGRELYLNGRVNAAQVAEANKRRQVECTLNLSPSDLLILNKCSETERTQFLRVWEEAQQYLRRRLAARIAEERRNAARLNDNIRVTIGLPKVALEATEQTQVIETPQLLLPFLETVHSTIVHSTGVECTGGEDDGENASVRHAASLLPIENTRVGLSAAARSSALADVLIVAEGLKIDAAAAETLLMDCRQHTDTVTAEEVVELGRQVTSKPKTNRIGLLMVAVPPKAAGATLEAARAAIVARQAAADAETARQASDAVKNAARAGERIEACVDELHDANCRADLRPLILSELAAIARDPLVAKEHRARAADIVDTQV